MNEAFQRSLYRYAVRADNRPAPRVEHYSNEVSSRRFNDPPDYVQREELRPVFEDFAKAYEAHEKQITELREEVARLRGSSVIKPKRSILHWLFGD